MKSFPIPAALVVALGVTLSGCATITRTPSTNWKVSSFPEGAEVTSSNGDHCDATPCKFRVPRKQPFLATVSKAGYEPSTLQVIPEMGLWGSVAFTGNVILGGLVGMFIDASTGSMLTPSHNGEIIRLKPYLAGEPNSLGATGDAIRLTGAIQGCSADKAAYARQIGVPCEALSGRVTFNPGPLQTASQ